jgi:hypothetical protein
VHLLDVAPDSHIKSSKELVHESFSHSFESRSIVHVLPYQTVVNVIVIFQISFNYLIESLIGIPIEVSNFL